MFARYGVSHCPTSTMASIWNTTFRRVWNSNFNEGLQTPRHTVHLAVLYVIWAVVRPVAFFTCYNPSGGGALGGWFGSGKTLRLEVYYSVLDPVPIHSWYSRYFA